MLLIGGGGREHAIARALEDSEADLYACAGNKNPGIARIATAMPDLLLGPWEIGGVPVPSSLATPTTHARTADARHATNRTRARAPYTNI